MSADIQELGVGEKEKENTARHFVQIEDLKSTPVEDHSVTFPEGGFQAWATVLGGFLVQFCAFGWIGSINTFLIVALGIPIGRLCDRGHFYKLMFSGSLLVSFSLFMLSLTKSNQYYQVLLSQGFGVGIGIGMIYIPSVAIQAHYFYRSRSLVMTLVASGSSVGSIIHPIMLNNLLSTIGFAKATRANAGLISGLLFVSCLLMRTRIPPLAVMPDFKQALVKFSKDKAYICCSLGLLFFSFGLLFPVFYLQLDAIRHNQTSSFAFYSLVIMNGGSLLGCLIAGVLSSDKLAFRAEIIMIISSACYCALLFANSTMTTVASITAMAVLYRFFPGIFTSLAAPMIANLADDPSEIGLRMGFGLILSSLADLFASPIDGALLTAHNHWWRPAEFSSIATLMACFFLVAMKYFMRKTGQEKQKILHRWQLRDNDECRV